MIRAFAASDDIFCIFEGVLRNLPELRQQYGLSKSVSEALLVIEAYRALRDRAPYPPEQVVGHLEGSFAFIVYDNHTGKIFVASVSIPSPISSDRIGSDLAILS
jgi:asparagine synthetase B (glutamine-hydrolysing)